MRTFFIALLSLLASKAVAEGPTIEELQFGPDDIRISNVIIRDMASDGCWTNLTETRMYLEEQLRIRGYTNLNSPNGEWITDEERERAAIIARDLPRDVEEHHRQALFGSIIQSNVYEAVIRVNAARSKSGFCYGGTRIGLYRWTIAHTEKVSTPVEIQYVDQIFINTDNLNIPIIELSKQFVDYISTGSFKE